MRAITTILILLQICACNTFSKDKDVDKIASSLAGSWVSTGVFINNAQLHDTLEVYSLFDSSGSVTTNVIALQTDSGNYEYHYKPSKEVNHLPNIEDDFYELVDIQPCHIIYVTDFAIQSDNKGVYYWYRFDATKQYVEHPKHEGLKVRFELVNTDSMVVVLFNEEDNFISHAGVIDIASDSLTILWNGNVVEKFKKNKLAPTTE